MTPRRTLPATSSCSEATSAARASSSAWIWRAPADHGLALLGELAGAAVDQDHAELLLEPGHVGGHVRLDGVELAGRGREAAGVGHGQQGVELSEVHRSEMMTHISENCWTDLVQRFTIELHTAEVSVRPPRIALEPGLRTSPPVHNPTKELAIPLASFFPFPGRRSIGRRRPTRCSATVPAIGHGLRRRPMAETAARPTAAAFFDLDRTLLSGASGPAITAALRAVGLVSDRSMPGQDLIFRVFNVFGENLPSMMLTRQAASLAANWSRAQRPGGGPAGGRASWSTWSSPTPRCLMSEHRQAGRPLVLATTTPYDLVKPLADRLGFDAVVATRYGERDGVYDGSIDGEFVWGHGKYRAVGRVGRRARRRPGRQLRLLRQLLRRPAAQRGRPPRRGQPRPAHAPAGPGPSLAHPLPRRAAGRAQAGRHRAPAAAHAVRATRADPVRQGRRSRASTTSR